ncbi:hypothetical protein E2C01_045032 [Portunus trituberculatus]|uniref:Uncharacterized protein n=1 Tax=Portunus trituberculatus TaxID=210409 RepID=A0A5B7FUM9_PORTR|nr:hypothetical protein [Portunus trituberculatus]
MKGEKSKGNVTGEGKGRVSRDEETGLESLGQGEVIWIMATTYKVIQGSKIIWRSNNKTIRCQSSAARRGESDIGDADGLNHYSAAPGNTSARGS